MKLFSLILFMPAIALAEEPVDSGALAHELDRLSTAGRVLYVAAHPDDENTRLLAYLANGRHFTVAYLSMTRGGGGQNLIGPEQVELLDVIRTQELLAARTLDGAVQRFTRMRDFGYSKTADETLAIWGREEALSDVVRVIRSFRPDVIITRFDENPPNHGHHTASAVLAREAFEAAADPKRFPELGPAWKTDRLLHNASSWRPEGFARAKVQLDVGAYDPRLGLSYGELAARSRSMHKSQGFGVAGERGPLVERFESTGGTKVTKDLFEDLDLSWRRFGAEGERFAAAIAGAKSVFDPEAPEKAIPALLRAHRLLDDLPDVPRTRDARARLEEVIRGAAGLFLRATADRPGATPGSEAQVEIEVVMRRPADIEIERALMLNEKVELSRKLAIPREAPISAPHWLARAPLAGRFQVEDPELAVMPEGPPPLSVDVEATIGGRNITYRLPVLYVWTDRVHGERERPFLVMPPATITPAREAVMLANGRPAQVFLRVRAGGDGVKGTVRLPLPKGWRVEPASHELAFESAGEEVAVRFEVTAPRGAKRIDIAPAFESGGRSWSHRIDIIDYPHIPMQVVLQPSSLALVPLSIAVPTGLIGYVVGSGDTIPEDLAHVGARVETIDDQTLRSGDLKRYSAILIGIRAYNTRAALKSSHTRLMRYVAGGGTVVVQYNTSSRWDPLSTPIGPHPLVIGRSRVTDQTAPMTAIDPKSPLLSTPNRLGPGDFEGWVQERGLYFAEKWDDRYHPLFTMHDPGEEPLQGGLLFTKHGRGRYVYTGVAFFRQLPAGVPGAYRLLANLIGG